MLLSTRMRVCVCVSKYFCCPSLVCSLHQEVNEEEMDERKGRKKEKRKKEKKRENESE